MGWMHAPRLQLRFLVVLPSAHGRPRISNFPTHLAIAATVAVAVLDFEEIINFGVLIQWLAAGQTRRMSRRPSPEPFAALQPTSRNAAFEVVHAPSNIESHVEKGYRVTDR
jgi:hypothetical protein